MRYLKPRITSVRHRVQIEIVVIKIVYIGRVYANLRNCKRSAREMQVRRIQKKSTEQEVNATHRQTADSFLLVPVHHIVSIGPAVGTKQLKITCRVKKQNSVLV